MISFKIVILKGKFLQGSAYLKYVSCPERHSRLGAWDMFVVVGVVVELSSQKDLIDEAIESDRSIKEKDTYKKRADKHLRNANPLNLIETN